LAIVIAILWQSTALAAPQLRFNNAYVDTTQRGAMGVALFLPEPRTKTPVRRIVQFVAPLTAAQRVRLSSAGVHLGEYLPDNAYIASMQGCPGAEIVPFATWVGAQRPAWKLDPLIGVRGHDNPSRQVMAAQGQSLLDITLYQGADAQAAARDIARVAGAQATIISSVSDHTTLRVQTATANALPLCALSSVLYVQEAPEATLRDLTQKAIVQSGGPTATPVHDHGVTGLGQILGIIDQRVFQGHCAFAGKILQYNTTPGQAFHGTLVASIAVGNDGVNDELRGVAFDAQMVYNLFPDSIATPAAVENADLVGKFNLHHSQGARVHTNSWGWDQDTSYNGWARAVDEFTWNNEDDVVVFAVTNLATLRTPENAKNALAVGGSNDSPFQNSIATGGMGPTTDGRRKPEVFAPGAGTRGASILNTCAVTSGTGTSFAAPAVAGSALLARQYFMDGFYPSGVANAVDALTPSGALLRAIIINASNNMTGAPTTGDIYPSNEEGWGLLSLDGSLFFAGDNRTTRIMDARNASPGALTTGGLWTREIRVLSPAEQFRVTLAWTEPPATLGAAVAAINDLNLEVISPTGTSYKGNVFDTVARQSATGGAFDTQNNIEQVHITGPRAGDWRVIVHGDAVNVGPQGFAVVITGAVGDVPPCNADFDGDRIVGPSDLLTLLAGWGGTGAGDATGDGIVGPADLLALLASFGPCP